MLVKCVSFMEVVVLYSMCIVQRMYIVVLCVLRGCNVVCVSCMMQRGMCELHGCSAVCASCMLQRGMCVLRGGRMMCVRCMEAACTLCAAWLQHSAVCTAWMQYRMYVQRMCSMVLCVLRGCNWYV